MLYIRLAINLTVFVYHTICIMPQKEINNRSFKFMNNKQFKPFFYVSERSGKYNDISGGGGGVGHET